MPMRFSPLLVSNLIIRPLQYFFSYYAGSDLLYDSDEKKTKIEIGSYNDFHKIPIQMKPRILVNRGSFQVRTVGLSDNMAEGKTLEVTKGLQNEAYLVLVEGAASLMIEARNEGTVELMTDMVAHFLTWTRPYICNTQNFKNFGLPLGVSLPTPSKEDKEIFQVTMNIPYIMEENWHIANDGLKLNNFFTNITLSGQ